MDLLIIALVVLGISTVVAAFYAARKSSANAALLTNLARITGERDRARDEALALDSQYRAANTRHGHLSVDLAQKTQRLAVARADRDILKADVEHLRERLYALNKTRQDLSDGLAQAQSWRASLDEVVTLLVLADRAKPAAERRWTGVSLAPVIEWITHMHRDVVEKDRPAAEEEISSLLDAYKAAL